MAHKLFWADQTITLEADDVDRVRDAITEAVRAGGGWVDLKKKSATTSVFVSAGQYIRIAEVSDRPMMVL